ncbi:MAG: FAD-dependent monooxygenase [Aeromicrobium sp.]
MTTSSTSSPAASTTVVVVGNGPVGQTAALLLARWEIPVLLLDARPARDRIGSKAICQQRDVLDIWDTVGAGTQIAREGLTWTTSRTFFQDDELFAQTFQDRGRSPFPPFVNISQTRTEELLDQQIAATPLIDVRWGHRVVSLQQDDTSVTVQCETQDGVVEEIGAYALICAGARGELLRQLLGVTFDGQTFGDQFLICDIRTSLPGWEDERRFYFDPQWNPGRQVLIHPCPDSAFRIDWQVPQDFDLAAEEATGALDARIRHIVGDADYEILWQSVYRFHARVADKMTVGRVLIAGDSAHLVAPFGARGLNSGVQDAENAAWKLAYVLRGWAPARLLDSYDAERHAAAEENLAVTAATMRFLVPQNEEEADERLSTLTAARTDAGAHPRVDSGRLAEPFWYVESPLSTPNARLPFTGRPPKGQVPPPGPGVLVPDTIVTVAGQDLPTRLRLLARGGHTLLAADDVDIEMLRMVASDVLMPVAVHEMRELASDLPELLGAQAGEVWVLRPDAHIAAVLPTPDVNTIRSAIDRTLAATTGAPV